MPSCHVSRHSPMESPPSTPNTCGPQMDASHVVVAGGHAAIVDTGPNTAVPLILAALEKLAVPPDAVDFLFLTHVHLDHAGARSPCNWAEPICSGPTTSSRRAWPRRRTFLRVQPGRLQMVAGGPADHGARGTERVPGVHGYRPGACVDDVRPVHGGLRRLNQLLLGDDAALERQLPADVWRAGGMPVRPAPDPLHPALTAAARGHHRRYNWRHDGVGRMGCFAGDAGLHGPVAGHGPDPVHRRPAALPLSAARLLRAGAGRGPALRLDAGALQRLLRGGGGAARRLSPAALAALSRSPVGPRLRRGAGARVSAALRGHVAVAPQAVGAAPAAFGAMAATFCGFTLVHGVHPNMVGVLAHVPWLLWVLDGVAARHVPATRGARTCGARASSGC